MRGEGGKEEWGEEGTSRKFQRNYTKMIQV
jgi:hypothetical protein